LHNPFDLSGRANETQSGNEDLFFTYQVTILIYIQESDLIFGCTQFLADRPFEVSTTLSKERVYH